jgi:DNA-binding MarR family transcriptional regulator
MAPIATIASGNTIAIRVALDFRGGVTQRLRDDEMRAWQALLHAHSVITGRLDAELRAEHGISLDAYDVLLRRARAPDRSLLMSQLAERGLEPPSPLARRVDRLVEDGLLERTRIPDDSRAMVARLTDTGLALLRRAARTHVRGIQTHFTGRLSDDQLLAVRPRSRAAIPGTVRSLSAPSCEPGASHSRDLEHRLSQDGAPLLDPTQRR